MQALEMPAMMAALVLAFAVIIAKVMITQLIGRMNRQINQVSQVKSEALGRLKGAQGQKQIIAKNKMLLDKKMRRLKKEMGEMKEEEDARRKRSESRRVS
jgi:50S ribosomal subunit-associated GTPase HflX|tara:strand:- start:58 stop:357 length:300 start_codon:yes stop_codon:yes gene_type:complete